MRIVWNASSTLEESNADVSKKDNPYFSLNTQQHRKKTVLNVPNEEKCNTNTVKTVKFWSLLE